MTTLALVLGAIALVGSVVAFVAVRALFHLLTDVRDHMKVLHVSVYGLETKLSSRVDGAREASEAALVRVGDLVTAMNALNANAEVETAREADVREALGGRNWGSGAVCCWAWRCIRFRPSPFSGRARRGICSPRWGRPGR